MTSLATRLRRALCRHDWLPMLGEAWRDVGLKCRKCGMMRRVES